MRKLIVIFFSVCILIASAAVPIKKQLTQAKQVDINAVVDSAMIFCDDYAEAITNKPGMANVRLNAIKRFYTPYASNKVVADTICNSIFNVYVDNVERGNADRAAAFKECFLQIANKDNENLGPMYATEISIAMERFDTTTVINYIPILTDYSQRLGYDYDEVLQLGTKYVNDIRTRRPLREALPGIWVSEDVAGVSSDDGVIDAHKGKHNNINFCKLIQIRDAQNPIYSPLLPLLKDSIWGLDAVRLNISGQKSYGSDTYTCVVGYWEQAAHNIQPLASYNAPKDVSYLWSSPGAHGKKIVIDNNCYSAYIFWGDERLKRNNADIGAIIRQTTQNMQAMTVGHLSRSKYSNAERMAGNLAADMVSLGINSLVDALMVSTDLIWSIEITFHMINPYCMEGEIFSTTIESKSNSSKVKPYTYSHRTRFYRWEPEDDVAFVGAENNIGNTFTEDKPWITTGMIFLLPPSEEYKQEAKRTKAKFEEEYKAWYLNKKKEYKDRLKATAKGSDEYKKLELEYKQFRTFDTAPKAWQKWNRDMLAKLKAKSDNYRP